MEVHHRDHNHANNAPENLEKLCDTCHLAEHGCRPSELLKRWRGQARISQRAIAEALGLHITQIRLWENGSKPVTDEMRTRWLEALRSLTMAKVTTITVSTGRKFNRDYCVREAHYSATIELEDGDSAKDVLMEWTRKLEFMTDHAIGDFRTVYSFAANQPQDPAANGAAPTQSPIPTG